MRPALRLLPLPICIALSLAAHADNDIPVDWSLCPIEDAIPAFPDAQPPIGRPEDRDNQVTDIEGDQTMGVDGGLFNVTGNVILRRGDQFLGTDHIEFFQDTGTFTAIGNVRYQDSGMRVIADRLEGDQNTNSHRIDNVRYQLTERRGNGGAERIDLQDSRGRMFGSTYSTCPPSQRWWELSAQRIDVDTDEGTGVARNATLRIGNVPVLFVPWLAFPIDDRRRTGLLYPSIGLSSRNGFDWRQPIYINLAPHYDMTVTPRWMSRRGLQLGTEFRYLTARGRGTLELQALPSDDLTWRDREDELVEVPIAENRRREDRGMLHFRGSERFNRTWQVRTNLYWISDPRWVEDASSNVEGRSVTSLRSTLGLYGRGAYWNAGIEGQYRHLTDYTLAESRLPYNRMPRAYVSWEQPFGQWLVTGVDAQATRFSHIDPDAKPGGNRLDIKPFISMPLEGASWFVRPTLAWRYTGYQLEDALAAQISPSAPDTSPSRSQPIGSIDAGLFFDRNTRFRGQDYLHTLEPRLFYLNSPYREQDNMPLFDTRPMTFSWGQLFRDNRYSGADRQADANQLTLALTSRLIRESDGREKLTASIGQIHYFEDSLVTIGRESPIEKGSSAWVTDTSYAVNDRWTIGVSYQWNPATSSEDLVTLRTRYLIGDDGIVNFSYRYRRNTTTQADLLEQVDLSFLYPLNPSWSLVGRYYYSLKDRQVLEGIAGVQWESCCVAARLVSRRYVRNSRGELNDSIQLEVELKGLGSAGPDNRSRLRRAILGYYRDDLYLVPPSELRDSVDDDISDIPLP